MFLTYKFRIHRKSSIVAKAIKVAIAAFIAGNFETKAQSLAMRLAKRGCWRPCYYTYSIFNVF